MRRCHYLASVLLAALVVTTPLAARATTQLAARIVSPVPARDPQRLAVHPQDTGFLNRVIVLNGVSYRYVVYLPIEYDARRSWPTILFLHGSGERGSDGMDETQVGLPNSIRAHPERWPFIVVMPQVPYTHHHWTDPDMMQMALATLDAEMKEFHGDPERVYLTGLSLGGYGSWQIAIHHPGIFAAAAIICGGIVPPSDEASLVLVEGLPAQRDPYGWAADRVGRLPVWIFHGSADNVVPPEGSRRMYAALKERHADVRFTEFPGVNHGSWVPAYALPELWPWMFSHRLADPQR